MGKNNYGQRANDFALRASTAARFGHKAKEKWDILKKTFKRVPNVAHDFWVGIITVFCLIVMSAEVSFSYDIYEDIAQKNTESAFLVFVFALFVIVWGLISSHLISARISRTVRELKIKQEIQEGDLETIAPGEVKNTAYKHFKFGVISSIGVIGFVFTLSLLRIGSLEVINSGEAEYTYLDLLLPSMMIALEILSGIYLAYIVSRISAARQLRTVEKAYELHKQDCHKYTENTKACFDAAKAGDEEFMVSKELEDALYRYTHRSVANDNYLDPITEEKVPLHKNGHVPDAKKANGILTKNTIPEV